MRYVALRLIAGTSEGKPAGVSAAGRVAGGRGERIDRQCDASNARHSTAAEEHEKGGENEESH